eukprot:1941886-Pyramimonas_sp.AAC.1
MHPEYVVPFEYLYVICKNGCTRHEPQAFSQPESEVSVKCRQTPVSLRSRLKVKNIRGNFK